MRPSGEILVLDDEPIVCERLQGHLEKRGFTVETFTESQAALNRLAEKTFDVVVTDVKMKRPTGLEVLRFVRDQNTGTQVIVFTGYSALEESREAELCGAFKFLTKPFKMEEVEALVREAVSVARKRRGKLRA